MEISKELLSKVLDNEVPYQVKVHKIIIKNNSLNYFYNSKDSGGGLFEANEYINIYELAHKCKEWALSKGYEIVSMADTTKIYKNKYEIYNVTNKNLYCLENFFESCEYILKELK